MNIREAVTEQMINEEIKEALNSPEAQLEIQEQAESAAVTALLIRKGIITFDELLATRTDAIPVLREMAADVLRGALTGEAPDQAALMARFRAWCEAK